MSRSANPHTINRRALAAGRVPPFRFTPAAPAARADELELPDDAELRALFAAPPTPSGDPEARDDVCYEARYPKERR